MCGIAGIVDFREPIDADVLATMRDTLAHRGPDSAGIWLRHRSLSGPQVGLAHRRLAIVDCSPAGHQPMLDPSGQLVVSFNGEIYNYRELAAELTGRGHTFRTESDTEVLLAAYAEWGEVCVERFNGMWAFAIWDARRRRLFASRDRLGKKPFFYHWNGHQFIFGSEIKALLAHPAVACRTDDAALARYCATFALPAAGGSMFAGIAQLSAAHSLSLDDQAQLTLRRYWQLDPSREVRFRTDAEYVERFRELFDDAVRLRLRADVSVGSSLSGGLDSSLIVGTIAAQRRASQAGGAQRTFSARFPERPTFDEGHFIDQVVAHTGVSAATTIPRGDDLLANVRRLHLHQEEPFLSSSIFAQWQVMSLARSEETLVLLDGQGSDELLAGYAPHVAFHLADLIRGGHWLQAWREQRAISARQHACREHIADAEQRTQLLSWSFLFEKLLKRGRETISRRLHPQQLAMPSESSAATTHRGGNRLWRRLFDDLTSRSIPLLLRYVDRNSMAFGVEVRNPFLDYRLVEFAMGLPNEQKLRDGWSKYVLREAGRGVLPEGVRTRTDKVAFITPEDEWLRGPLRDWGREALFSPRMRSLPGFPAAKVERLWQQHQSGSHNLRQHLWPWLSLAEWLAMIDERALLASPRHTPSARLCA